MSDETRVWIGERKLKSGKWTKEADPATGEIVKVFTPDVSYHLRWIDPGGKGWKSEKAGTDRKVAIVKAATLEKKLADGTHFEIKRATWQEFIEYHVGCLEGEDNKKIAKRTLEVFSEGAGVDLRRVSKADVKTYVGKLREKGNSPATINKATRYLRHAFNVAVDDGYMPANPITRGASKGKGWKWEKEPKKKFKALTPEQEQAIVTKAKEIADTRMQAFVYLALHTGGRRDELLSLQWASVDWDGESLTFTKTKDLEDRTIFLTAADIDVLRKLKVQTLQQPGPFTDWTYDETYDRFCKIRVAAGLPKTTIHDLRRCFVTNLIRANVELSAVQKLAGHSTILTTLAYYNAVHENPDLKAATAKLRTHSVG